MNRQEIEQRLAEAREQLTAIEEQPHIFNPRSPKHAWIATNAGSWDDGSTCTEWRWEPRPLDSEYAMELLKEAQIDVGPSVDGKAWTAVPDEFYKGAELIRAVLQSRADSPEEAIAIAYILYAEYKERRQKKQ